MERDFTVLFRVRPSFLPTAPSTPLITTSSTDPCKVTLHEPRNNTLTSNITHTPHTFSSDACFLATSPTCALFTSHVEPLIPFVLLGGYATVLAYGQTGSGKTYTLSECSRLCILSLYDSNASRCSISIQAIEVYGKNKVNDLFDPSNTRVLIAENIAGSSTFSRATLKIIHSPQEMLNQVEQAWSQRITRGTEKNPQSSRSHALIRIACQPKNDKNATPGVLQLVDLAGSERAADHSPTSGSTNTTMTNHAQRMAETVAINTPLMTLKSCIRARTSPSSCSDTKGGVPHIPFRSSKLTLALKEAFDLYSRQPTHTVFIATASPDLADVAATLNTLRYASALVICPHERIELEPDALGRNVFFWSPKRLSEWLIKYGQPLVTLDNVASVQKGEDGAKFAKLPEAQFYQRLQQTAQEINKDDCNSKNHAAAKELYLKWWKLVIASRTLSQKALQEQWKQRQALKLKQEEIEIREDKDVQSLLNLPEIARAPSKTAAV
ncbi:related to Kinesin-like protein KIF2C [Ustilago trichophora]|uniref:Kinesin-like protein n=1 Tax=Ustilago trichophora TaxID=86804 RepID=A0A5C3EN86_9BASI|nr:related to Kinesin-like protein KIF2C [Ustilago trichophora]